MDTYYVCTRASHVRPIAETPSKKLVLADLDFVNESGHSLTQSRDVLVVLEDGGAQIVRCVVDLFEDGEYTKYLFEKLNALCEQHPPATVPRLQRRRVPQLLPPTLTIAHHLQQKSKGFPKWKAPLPHQRREQVKLSAKHHLDVPTELPEWWTVEVSWESYTYRAFTTEAEALTYSQKRVERLVKSRANSKKYLPLVVEWEDCPYCFHRALLGPELHGVPVWDYEIRVHHYKRSKTGTPLPKTRQGLPVEW